MSEVKVGARYGRLVVLEIVGSKIRCVCECGKNVFPNKHDVKVGKTKSCGCLRIERLTKHGMHNSRLYSIWRNMLSRCNHDSYPSYERYGGRGITVDDSWRDFETFRASLEESYLEHVDKHGENQTTLDRIDNDGDYVPGNVKWSTRREQVINRGVGKNNSSGYVGVSRSTQEGRWRSRITINCKEFSLGLYDTPEEAHEAREKFKKEKGIIK